MPDKPQRASEIRNWLQMLFVVAGVGVGVWEFVFKEIWTPSRAPINLTTEVSIKEAGFRGTSSAKGQDKFEAIELTVAAKNPSNRDVYLLKNCWYALGATILTRKENDSWRDNITKQIEDATPANEGAYYNIDKAPVVAASAAFADTVLHPNESVSSSFVFYVPQDVFDVVYVHIILPTTAVEDSAEAVWTVTPDNGCDIRVYRKRNGARAEEIKDTDAAIKDRGIGLQAAGSTRELSLWQSKPH